MNRHNPFSTQEPAPSSGRARLHEMMAEIIDIETGLDAARSRYSEAIRQSGGHHIGIFSACIFVSRTTLEHARAEAFLEGKRAAKKEAEDDTSDSTDDMVNPGDDTPTRRGKKKKLKPAADDEKDNPDEETETDTVPEKDSASYQAQVRRTAAAIVAAGAGRRGEAPKQPSPTDAAYARDLAVASDTSARLGCLYRVGRKNAEI